MDPLEASRRILASPADLQAAGWRPVVLPGYSPDPRNHAIEGWFLKVLHIADAPPDGWALRLGKIDDRDRAYFNGELIGATGEWDSPRIEAYDRIRIYDIPDRLLRPGDYNVVLVQVQTLSPPDLGLVKDKLSIGPQLEIRYELFEADLIEALFLALYLSVAGYFFFLFARRRVERENLFFGLFLLAFVGYQGLRTQFRFEYDLSFFISKRVE